MQSKKVDGDMASKASRTPARRKIVWRPVANLKLDPENPRIISAEQSQKSLLRYMVQREGLLDLAHSFANSGYFVEEPLVVVKDSKESDKFIVVEGNRRLSALKLLLDDETREAILGKRRNWPALTDKRRQELEEVPTIEYGNRSEVMPFLGFRHITGIKTWDSFAKARYVADLINNEHLDISEVEERIGDNESSVKKYYQAYVVYDQLLNELGFPVEPVRSDFSKLQVALGQTALKDYLGVPRRLPNTKIQEVVPADKIEKLEKVVTWIYGNEEKGVEPVISDTRQINQYLSAIVRNKEAIAHLDKNGDVEAAYEYSDGEKEFCLKQIRSAERGVQRALQVAPYLHDDPEVVSAIERLSDVISGLVAVVKR